MKVTVLKTSDGYEAVYLDGVLYDEGRPLGEGNDRLYFLELHIKHPDITPDSITFRDLTEEEEETLDGSWPSNLHEIIK